MREFITHVVAEQFGQAVEVQLSRPESRYGDYATNVAMQLAGRLGKKPRDVAEQIAEKLRTNEDFIEVSVAGPGFINIRLSDAALIRQIYTRPEAIRRGRQVVIETNNPNPFKPMHIGHAYNAVLGDTMANLLAVSGADVKRVSYHGDVGAHVGKSMWALLRYCGGDADKLSAIPAGERNVFMGKMYAEGAKAAKEDEQAAHEIDELARQSFTREDPLYARVYDTVFDWSFAQIDAVMARIGNLPIERRYLESAADTRGVETVRAHVPDVFTESDGALIFEGSKHGSFDNVFVASSGLGLYGARDVGLVQLKSADYPDMDECIVVTGGEQAAYFRGVIAAVELALPELRGKLKNYPTGLVKLSSGKMSSRTGDVVTIGWLFDEFGAAIKQRGGEPADEIIAGALRYQFLKVKIGGDVVFDINEAVSLTGNTGSYLQYAHARARRILEKSSHGFALPHELYDEDRPLIRKLSEYHETVDLATRELAPHHVCNYLFELAQEFNRYYEKHHVIGDEKEAHRISLVALYADILQAGLGVLGIKVPERM
ncbi:arginine--tRNA ligase [Candidatus Saccharibacteria bacterium]|nr:MAG: arginine--tRNA ligase [Candidatus Saccharibacteria bacterium]